MNLIGSMLTSGDVVVVDFGSPQGREAGFVRPTVLVTAQAVLDGEPNVVHVVPLSSRVRGLGSEVVIGPDDRNGLDVESVAQGHHVRSVAASRIHEVRGNVGPVTIAQIRETLGLILDIA